MRIRSKARWIKKGEVSTKYFYSRFKIRINDSYIYHKISKDKCSETEALLIAHNFYQKLYKLPLTSSESVNYFLQNLPQISAKSNR